MTYKILIGWLVLGAVPLGCTGDLNVGPFAPDASSEGSTGVVDDATTDGSGFDASMPETGVAQDAGPETSVADAGTDGSTDGGLCIEIPALAASDLSCDSDQDCTLARSGSVCSCQCSCPEAVANSAAYERIEALAEPALVWRSSCDSGACGCVSDVLLHCFALRINASPAAADFRSRINPRNATTTVAIPKRPRRMAAEGMAR
jgi:hypothetical protein